MRFLFCLDLNLFAGAGKKFGIWNFASKHGLTYNLVASIDVLHYCPVLTRSSVNRYFNNFISAGI